VLEVNLTGAFLTPRALAPRIRAGGSIVTEYMTGATIDMNSGRLIR
jgi:NAD(P)-dependent dehydrogenase (short-subunit alcohol dehydrogenase family)